MKLVLMKFITFLCIFLTQFIYKTADLKARISNHSLKKVFYLIVFNILIDELINCLKFNLKCVAQAIVELDFETNKKV